MLSTKIIYKFLLLLCCYACLNIAQAQENSPFSRYGLGDVQPSTHILNRGMGGVSAAYGNYQNINFNNPATFSQFKIMMYDIGFLMNVLQLKDASTNKNFSSAYFIPTYVALGLPLNAKKNLGLSIGFKPVSRINYSVLVNSKQSLDSTQANYIGQGGLNQVYFGIGKKWKQLSVGIMGGYLFGQKNLATHQTVLHDTLVYAKADYANKTNYGGFFATLGVQHSIFLDSTYNPTKRINEYLRLNIGATVTVNSTMTGNQALNIQTYKLDANSAVLSLDSIYKAPIVQGKIALPMSYNLGFLLQKYGSDQAGLYDSWSVGMDFSTTQWSKYKFFGQPDQLTNSWALKLGGQWTPNTLKKNKNYYKRTSYRLGFIYGKDYLLIDNKSLKNTGFTIGASFPIRPPRYSYQFSLINIAFEYFKRGPSVTGISETYYRLTLGLSLSDVWFIKRRYD